MSPKKERAFTKLPSDLDVIYEDEALIIVNKPVGLLAHSDTSQLQDNLADRLLHYLYRKGEYDPDKEQSFAPALCHRIDRNTQGIVICAKTSEALRQMNEVIRERELDKRYLCIVEGSLKKKQDLWCYIIKRWSITKQISYLMRKKAINVLKQGIVS